MLIVVLTVLSSFLSIVVLTADVLDAVVVVVVACVGGRSDC